MRRGWVAVVLVLVAGCGVRPSGVTDAGEAPTGVAPGVTLYFVDSRHELVAQVRRTDRLGTISEAMTLLLSGPGDSAVGTEITPTGTTRVVVTSEPGTIHLMVPLAVEDVTPTGVDQIVCTALAVHVQGGGSPVTAVVVRFIQPTPESAVRRTCPVIR
ncbi:hypothetical protein [Actinophytocola sediminis]